MLEKLRVIEVLEDTIICFSEKKGKVTLDVEGLIVRFEVGDEIVHVEHGFCDIYRGREVVGGMNNYYTRLIQ